MSGPGLQGGKDDGDRDECRELERECPGGVHLETGAELEVDGIAESDGDRRGRDATGQDDRADDTDRGGRDCCDPQPGEVLAVDDAADDDHDQGQQEIAECRAPRAAVPRRPGRASR